MRTVILAAALAAFTTPMWAAGPIEKACKQSDRSANRAVCGCIQDVANQTLTKPDQSLAATFFKNPHRAQEVRQSDNRGHEAFWKRYKNFGATAEVYCSAS